MRSYRIQKIAFLILVLFLAAHKCSLKTEAEVPAFEVSTLADLGLAPGSNQSDNQIPQGIATDGENIYLTDFFNHTVLKVSLKTGKESVFAGVSGVSGFRNGNPAAALFSRPFGIVCTGGNLYVADSANSVIRRISLATGEVSTFAGKPGAGGHLNGNPEKAMLRFPHGIATDGKLLYVADTGNSTVRKIDLATRQVGTVAGMAGVAGLADGVKDQGRFNAPKGLATDGTNIYVADTINGALRKVVIETGAVTTLAGKDFQPGASDGRGVEARFNNPTGVTVMDGIVYVADTGNSKIRRVDPETGEVITIAGKHFFESNCPLLNLYRRYKSRKDEKLISPKADGKGRQARFQSPGGITTDGKKLYVIDTKNRLVRVLVKN